MTVQHEAAGFVHSGSSRSPSYRDTLATHHAHLYDELAQEYENRADSLRAITRAALDPLLVRLGSAARVLDVGCGVGLAAEALERAGHRVVALDLSTAMAAFSRQRLAHGDVRICDYREFAAAEPFDAVVAFAFIHLFPAPEAKAVLAKMYRDLKEGGFLFVGTTTSEWSREGWELKTDYRASSAPRFRKHWTEPELRLTVRQAGFDLVDRRVNRDPFGKAWLDLLLERRPRPRKAAAPWLAQVGSTCD